MEKIFEEVYIWKVLEWEENEKEFSIRLLGNLVLEGIMRFENDFIEVYLVQH